MTNIELMPDESSSEFGSDDELPIGLERSFEDLNLVELLGQFVRAPRSTYRMLIDTASIISPQQTKSPVMSLSTTISIPKPLDNPIPQKTAVAADRRAWIQLGLYISAFLMALWGGLILISAGTRYEEKQLSQGAPFLLCGFLIWLGAEIYKDWPAIKSWWQGRGQRSETSEAGDDRVGHRLLYEGVSWGGVHPIRVFAGIGTVIFSMLTWLNSAGNQFTFIGFWAWVFSILLIVITFAPKSWNPATVQLGFHRWYTGVHIRNNTTLFFLIAIFVIAAIFRFQDLDGVPPEMTSDHIEKLLDSWRVAEKGDRDIFFVNNGGREPFQMYAIALLSRLPGLGINFTTLKLLAVVESLITFPVLWWAGREVIGERDRRLGNLVGLILAALVAVSYWHVSITRLSLRIVLTPLVASLLLAYLSRCIHYNRTGDFILAGLVLGFGLYTYQAVRMLPIVIVTGIFIAGWFSFGQRRWIQRYGQNLLVLVIVSGVVFVPMFRFSTDFPEAFWMRTFGRMLGDEIMQEVDEAGNLVERRATLEERLEAFETNLPILTQNIRNALLMFNWKGDVAWINGVPNYPVMDSVTGAFLIIGLAAWLAMMVRHRDAVYVIVPLMVFIMLLPSALSIATPVENPSATRTSGSLPPAYLIAALPLALMVVQVQQLLSKRLGRFVALGMVGVIIFVAYSMNAETYLTDYRRSYELSWKVHSAPGKVLEGFAKSDGSYGNAFIIHSEHWLDHRIMGLEGGIIDWPNAIVSREKIPDFLNDAWRCLEQKYRLDPNQDLLFFYNQDDMQTEDLLTEWFPLGRSLLFEALETKDRFKTYRVPALGDDGLDVWINEYKNDPHC